LEQELERDAGKCLGEFKQVNSRALVFLENRAALVNGSETQAKHRFALQVDIRSQEHPELKAKSLRARLVKAFETRDGTIGVTRWNGNAGESSGGNDARVEGRNDPPFLWRYGQYLQAVREPADVRFAKFLMESGLAQRWGAADETVAALRSIYEQ
jgi:hypothetical protein